jgi:pimeloyl-ACP methyl ester carboxylesterase
MKKILPITVLLPVALSTLPASPAQASHVLCQDLYVPITLAVTPPEQTLYGELCVPPGGATTVFVMVHGSTYNRTYYDLPYKSNRYSMADALNDAGYATFNLDKVGAGNSSRPFSAEVTTAVQADAVHQVIQGLRAGEIGGASFDKVAMIGHSGGAIVAVIESLTYNDADGLVLEGLAHTLDPVETGTFFDLLYPANQDPKFAGQMLDPGYVTTKPGGRSFFHSQSDPVEKLLEFDEENKDIYALSPADDGLVQVVFEARTREIVVPALVAIGGEDRFFCTPLAMDCSSSEALLGQEAQFYGTAPLSAFVLPDAGHNLTMARDTKLYQDVVIDWSNQFVGTGLAQRVPPEG